MGYRARSRLKRYGVALAVVGVAAALRFALMPVLGHGVPFIIFFPGVLFAAWYGGARAGLTALAAATTLAFYLFLGPPYRFAPLGPADLFSLTLFVLGSAAMVLVTEMAHREQHRAETSLEALRRQHERFESIVTSLPGVVWEAWGKPDARDQRIDYVSPYVRALLGYSVEEWLGTPNFWLEIVHPEDREHAARTAAATFASGQPGVNEFRWVAKDGRVLWMHAQATPILDEGGRPAGLRGVTLDVSARKEAEERLRLVSEVAEGFGEVGLQVRELAQRIARRTSEVLAEGCTIAALEDGKLRTLTAYQRDPDAQRVLEVLGAAVTEGLYRAMVDERKTVATALFDADALSALVPEDRRALLVGFAARHAMMAPLVSRGRVFGAMAVWRAADLPFAPRDVQVLEAVASRAALALENATLYERAESALREAARESRVKDEFLATLSHELRTPLNAIVGWAHMLKEGRLDPETVARAAETIARNAMAQTQLVSDILDMQQVVSGKMRLNLQEVDLTDVVKAAADTVLPSASAKEIDLRLVLDPAAGPSWGDPARLQQVVWNVLSNAVKFTPRRGRVYVRLQRAASQAEITVEDNGPGIAPGFLPYVFDRFRQADASTTRRYGGLGLGLSIVRALVELHGGTVRAANASDGAGAVFSIQLPRARVMSPGAAVEPGRPASKAEIPVWLDAAPSLRDIAVLVVEDDPDSRELIASVLTACGAEVVTAASAGDALQQLQLRQVDVVVCDIHMPQTDGYAFMRRLRQLAPEQGGRVPAAALTAAVTTADRMEALSAGFQIHLAKPVQPAELVTAVASLALDRRAEPAPESGRT